MKEFNPQIGDTIVTKGRGNFICANYEEHIESKGLGYVFEYASKPICGVRDSGCCFMTWDRYGKCRNDDFNILEIIPKNNHFSPNPGDIIVTRNNQR